MTEHLTRLQLHGDGDDPSHRHTTCRQCGNKSVGQSNTTLNTTTELKGLQ